MTERIEDNLIELKKEIDSLENIYSIILKTRMILSQIMPMPMTNQII